jgi:hypothetical protein
MTLNVLEKSLNLTLPDMYEPCWVYARGYFAGLRVTKRNKATVSLALTLFQTPTLTLTLTLLQVCFLTNLEEKKGQRNNFFLHILRTFITLLLVSHASEAEENRTNRNRSKNVCTRIALEIGPYWL